MHSSYIYIPRAPHIFNLKTVNIHSQLYSFAYSIKLTHQSTQLLLYMSQPLVLDHLEITAGFSQSCHHSHAAVTAIPKHPSIHLSHPLPPYTVYIAQPWWHYTILSLSNIYRNPLLLWHTGRNGIKKKLCTAFNICHISCRSVVSYAFSKSKNAQNTPFPFVRYFSHICFTANTQSCARYWIKLTALALALVT